VFDLAGEGLDTETGGASVTGAAAGEVVIGISSNAEFGDPWFPDAGSSMTAGSLCIGRPDWDVSARPRDGSQPAIVERCRCT
jgi:hypothetical protein